MIFLEHIKKSAKKTAKVPRLGLRVDFVEQSLLFCFLRSTFPLHDCFSFARPDLG